MGVEFLRTSVNVGKEKIFINSDAEESSRSILIDGFVGMDQKPKGNLVAHFERKVDPSQDLHETDSFVRLNYIGVRMRKRGLGTVLLQSLKEKALELGAKRIVGIVPPVLVREQSFLLDFYKRNGFDFSLNPVDKNYDLVQNLSPNN